MIVTVGAALIVTVIEFVPTSNSESVTEAVIVWVPAISVLVLIAPPVPAKAPFRSDDHVIWLVRVVSSSSASVAFAVKLTKEPTLNVELFAGAVIATVGSTANAAPPSKSMTSPMSRRIESAFR